MEPAKILCRHLQLVIPGSLIVAGCVILGTEAAQAQSSSRRMSIVEESEGGPPRFMHATLPNLHDLRTPDFVQSDLPTFQEKLQLNDDQRLIVELLLDSYLEEFRNLTAEKLELAKEFMPAPMAIDLGGGEDLGKVLKDAVNNAAAGDVAGEAGGEAGGNVAIMISAGTGDGGGAGGGGAVEGGSFDVVASSGDESQGPSVKIALAGPDGQELQLSEEAKAKLEAKAAEIAEKIRKNMEEAQASGRGFNGPGISLEERRERFDELQEIADELRADKARLRDWFVRQVQAELSETQQPLWPGLERVLTRRKTLPDGRLDGERTDLVEILEKLDVADSTREIIDETLEA
ncbi:MAG: hypothetical protein ACYTGC_12195, partial [Planctomycetota bacterium]